MTDRIRTVNSVLRVIRRSSDTFLAITVIFMVMLIVIPLPTWILDLLLTVNITCSLVLILRALSITRPIDLAVFPGVLLLITIFRLSLNIASTRLILAQGYAGRVIEAFGSFVVGGNYTVGIIIFITLVVINFLVIVRGGERISEVAARFTLDAMPGKQMSVDADLNIGLIDKFEARDRRREISREAEYYGAMDGASKFVRGEAIAAIIITGINFLGGQYTGIAMIGVSFAEAVRTYTVLTVGDGLVMQIPALLVSTAMGLVVTRAAAVSDLGTDIQRQISAHPKALFMTSAALVFFGLTPGLPAAPFFAVSFMVAFIGFLSRKW